MRTGICSLLVGGKICEGLLLVVVTIALIFSSGNLALSQTGTGAATQVPLFTAIDLNPPGFVESWATGISGGQQVGYGYGPATGGYGHALLWHGTAASLVDLHPRGFMISRALGISDGQEVGFGISPQPAGGSHALLWHGTAGSVVDLNPNGFVVSEASGISGGRQVGYGYGPVTGEHRHALMWSGSAATVMDLHPDKYETSEAVGASGAQQVGWGTTGDCESGLAGRGCHYHVLLWSGTVGSVIDLGEGKAYGTSDEVQVGYGAHGNAVLWRGSAGSTVDLEPGGFYGSTASGAFGAEQVGYGGPWTQTHALLWRGDVRTLVDLHAFLPPGFEGSTATGIDSNGDIVGVAWGPATNNKTHAFLWTRSPEAKPSPARPVDKFIAFYSPLTPKALGVYTSSPTEFLLTDPLGNQSGFDPITKTSTPGYEYSANCDEQGSGGCGPTFKSLEMGSPMDGQYTLDVIGTGTGDFDVEVRISDAAGNWIDQSYSDTTAPGRISRFTFSGQVITFAALEATVKINLTSKAFEVSGTFGLSQGGVISPVTQPVTIELDSLSMTIPAGSFRQDQQGAFVFEGTTGGVALEANLTPIGGNGYTFKIRGAGADLARYRLDNNPYPIRVMLAIGNNGGSSDVKIEYAH